MRILLFIFLTVICVGCSSNQVTVTMRDGAKIESELLSVRDSSILIQEKGGTPIAIRNDDVEHVIREAPSPVGSIVVGGVFGAVIGFVSGGVFTPLTGCGGDCPQSTSIMLTGAAVGAGVGSLIGFLVTPTDKTFDLNDHEQRENLMDHSSYYDEEPDELKKIK